ncbi:proton channel OtopLc-like [Aricia agestis]|uniref:proton channel OtopLc-like n=1 Tax=Aricia agestis TaxID=91739 RepID=UPI001C20C2FD|nr:proton channel OtopLc-like [Aricia agestis]
MAENRDPRKEMLKEIVNRKNMGDKKFHSETSLQHFGEIVDDDDDDDVSDSGKDPGVTNTALPSTPSVEEYPGRRRTMSQPGPMSGNLLTATAARAARRRPQRTVNYADADKTVSDKPSDDDSLPQTPAGDLTPSPSPYTGYYRNGDLKSLTHLKMHRVTLRSYRGGMTPRKRSVTTMDAQSIRSVETHAPPPTSPEDNARLTKKYLTLILSCMYAVLLVTLGLIIYLSSPFVNILGNIYSLVLLGFGFSYQMYLLIDITRYKRKALKNQKIRGAYENKISDFYKKQEEEFNNGDRTPEGSRSQQIYPSPILKPLKHDYCFTHGRHSGSFYLKLGAAGFALGHLIHSILLITVQISFYYDETIDNDACVNLLQLTFDICSPLYCFVQLYFMFKYSNVLILRAQGLAHFGFMHMIGSSLCFWISTIVRETVLALTIYANTVYGNKTDGTEYETMSGAFYISEIKPQLDVSGLYDERCQGPEAITVIVENFSPYLYPFSVEFNIFIVAVYYIIWNHVGACDNEDNEDGASSLEDNQTVCKIPTANEENDYTSNIVIYADCHASNKGLFLGLILTVIVAGLLIIGFVFSSVDGDFLELGYKLNDITKLAMHVVLLFAAVFAYNQTRQLDINEHPVSLLDDILLFICLPAFFMETVFSMIATISILNVVKTIDALLMTIQILVQTTLLVDGLRRCSNSRKLRRKKPGRELVMFLLITNVAMWLFNTFSYKSPESLDERYEYYGKAIWTILGHISLPLIMFYRFHSSVCFADMWDAAYKPGSDH